MAATGSSFRLLDLPLEIRCHIYQLALPSHYQTALLRTLDWIDERDDFICSNMSMSEWGKRLAQRRKKKHGNDEYIGLGPAGTWSNIPNECMNLLLVNRQISHEARDILYSGFCPTIFVDYSCIVFLNKAQVFYQFYPIRAFDSLLRYTNYWQVDFDYPPVLMVLQKRYPPEGHSDPLILREEMGSVCHKLSQVQNLKSLKIKIPCFCCSGFQTGDWDESKACSLERERKLQSLVEKGVDVIAEARAVIREAVYPLKWLPQSAQIILVAMNRGHTAKCPKDHCQALTTGLVEDIRMVKGYPTPKEQAWLDLKVKLSDCELRDYFKYKLLTLWDLFDASEEADFLARVKPVEDMLPFFGEQELQWRHRLKLKDGGGLDED